MAELSELASLRAAATELLSAGVDSWSSGWVSTGDLGGFQRIPWIEVKPYRESSCVPLVRN